MLDFLLFLKFLKHGLGNSDLSFAVNSKNVKKCKEK